MRSDFQVAPSLQSFSDIIKLHNIEPNISIIFIWQYKTSKQQDFSNLKRISSKAGYIKPLQVKWNEGLSIVCLVTMKEAFSFLLFFARDSLRDKACLSDLLRQIHIHLQVSFRLEVAKTTIIAQSKTCPVERMVRLWALLIRVETKMKNAKWKETWFAIDDKSLRGTDIVWGLTTWQVIGTLLWVATYHPFCPFEQFRMFHLKLP